ncbi:MAG: hypothetical protein F4Y02_12935 [Chloroflexi bacterium]|nr:hypothetical protein [Chloroflexota bacterium]
MSLLGTIHAASTARYRAVLELGAEDLTTRREADPSADLPLPLTASQIDLMVERFAAKDAARLRKVADRLAKAERNPDPVPPRDADAMAYERVMRQTMLRPILRRIRAGLSTAVAVSQAIDHMDALPFVTSKMLGLIEREVAAQSRRIAGSNRKDLIATFRQAVAVDIGPVLKDTEIAPLMDRWRRENVSLLQTVPSRLHASLTQKIATAFAERPFDQQVLSQVVAQEGKVAGYNLRRIVRDQTNKMNGQLTRARHRQLGISQYVWRTVQDDRVRPTHAANANKPFEWADPPADTGHPGSDIQCRCTAQPVLPELGLPDDVKPAA